MILVWRASARQTPQRTGNLIGPVVGAILRRARRWGRRADPQQAIIDSMSDEEFGALLGPRWSAMTADQRERFPDRWTAEDWAAVDGVAVKPAEVA